MGNAAFTKQYAPHIRTFDRALVSRSVAMVATLLSEGKCISDLNWEHVLASVKCSRTRNTLGYFFPTGIQSTFETI